MSRKSAGEKSCIFCRIVSGEIPARSIKDDADLVAIDDVNPQAPVHALVIPRLHIPTLNDLASGQEVLIGKMVLAAKDVAAGKGLKDRGYRLVWNCLEEAGQSVFHLHLHILGGRRMAWPPG